MTKLTPMAECFPFFFFYFIGCNDLKYLFKVVVFSMEILCQYKCVFISQCEPVKCNEYKSQPFYHILSLSGYEILQQLFHLQQVKILFRRTWLKPVSSDLEQFPLRYLFTMKKISSVSLPTLFFNDYWLRCLVRIGFNLFFTGCCNRNH